MILKISRGGRIVRTSHNDPDVDISEQAIEYLFEGVELDDGVTLKDILLILKRNPILIKVFARRRAVEILEEVFAGPDVLVPGYGVENMEYLELDWGWSLWMKDTLTIWRKMSMDGVGYALREPLQTDYVDFPAGARQRWSVMFCAPRELGNYPLRINSKITMEPGCRPKLIDLDLPDLGKVIEGVLFGLTWFGSGEERESTMAEIIKASEDGEHQEIDVDDFLAELQVMHDKIDGGGES